MANLIANSGFEVNLTGWFGLSAPTLSRTTAESHTGVASMKVVTDGSASFEGVATVLEAGFTPGERYVFSVWIKGTAGSALRLRFEDDDETIHKTFGEATGEWQRVTISKVVADEATYILVGVLVSGTQITTYHVDDAELDLAPTTFVADGDSGDLSEWDYAQALPGRVTVIDGAFRFEVQEGDEEPDTGSQRAEVQSGLEYDDGDARYFRLLVKVESWDFGHWGIVWQMHDDAPVSPPLSLQVIGTEGAPALSVRTGDSKTEYWQEGIALGRWYEVVLHVVFGAKGSLEVWFQGEKQTLLNAAEIWEEIDTLGVEPAFDKLGIYRSVESEETAVVHHDDYRVTEEFFSEPPPEAAPVEVKVGAEFNPATRYVRVGGVFVEA